MNKRPTDGRIDTQGERRNKPQSLSEMLEQWGFSGEKKEKFNNPKMKRLLWMAYQLYTDNQYFTLEEWDNVINEWHPGVDSRQYLEQFQGMIRKNLDEKNYPVSWFLEQVADVRDLFAMLASQEADLLELRRDGSEAADLSEVVQEQQEYIEELKLQVQEARQDFNESEEEKGQLATTLSALRGEAQTAKAELRNYKDSVTVEMTHLRQENMDLANTLQRIQNGSEQTINQQDEEIEQVRTDFLEYKNRTIEGFRELEEQKKARERAEEEVGELRELLRLSRKEKQVLTDQVAIYKTSIDDIVEENERLKERAGNLERGIAKRDEKIERIQKTLDNLESQLDGESVEWQTQFDTYQDAIRDLEEEIGGMQITENNLKKQNRALEAGLSKKEKELEELIAQKGQTLEFFKVETQRLSKKVKELEGSVGSRAELSALREGFQELVDTNLVLQDERAQLAKERDRLSGQLATLQERTNRRRNKLQNLARKVQEILDLSGEEYDLSNKEDPFHAVGVLSRVVDKIRRERDNFLEDVEKLNNNFSVLRDSLEGSGYSIEGDSLEEGLREIKKMVEGVLELKKKLILDKETREEVASKVRVAVSFLEGVLNQITDRDGVPRPSVDWKELTMSLKEFEEKLKEVDGVLLRVQGLESSQREIEKNK